MAKKVLVTYASKYGATAEIAGKIWEVLSEAGLDVDIYPVSDVLSIQDYDGVVLGSSVYYGSWRKDAVKFLKKQAGTLAGIPTWLFSSGPVGEGDPVELLDGWTFPPKHQEIADRIQPKDIAVFHGMLDQTKLNKLENMVLENMESPAGDFRDWDSINSWSEKIALMLG